MSISRRKFLDGSGKLAIGSGLATFAINYPKEMSQNTMFIHHVFFWLNNPGSKQDLEALKEGLRKLSAVKNLKMFHIGKPADTNRDVIDTSYSISWLLMFDNLEEQEKYQVDPIHLKFVEECKHLWSKVIVYDSVNALS